MNYINLYIFVDLIMYASFASFICFVFLWFVIWITGLKDLIMFIYNCMYNYWNEILYFMISVSVISGIGLGFKHLLDIMDQNIVFINTDRRFLLQQNYDLMKENQEIKRVMQKLMLNIDIEDKNVLK